MVVGEFGGSITGKAGKTQQKLAQWLLENCMADAFWWCLNPATAYNGGMLGADYKTVDQNVLMLLDYLQPHPTRFLEKGKGKVCAIEGRPANARCSKHKGALADQDPPAPE